MTKPGPSSRRMRYSLKNNNLRAKRLFRHALLLFVALPSISLGQRDLLQPGDTVRDRPRPELDAQGMPVGSFRMLASLDVTGMYDSNVFAEPEGELDDWKLLITPRLDLNSDWGRHALDLAADADVVRFQDLDSEDIEDYSVFARLMLELTAHNRVRFSALTARDHEDRASPDDRGGFEPTPIDRDRLVAEYAYAGERRLRFRLRGTTETLDFQNVPGSNGVVNNDDRDRTENEFDLRGGFAINEGLALVLMGRTDTRDYDLAASDPRLDRTSDGVTWGVGLNGVLSSTLFADFIIGQTSRDYDAESLAKIDSTWYDGRIVWNPSGLTSLTLRATRGIRETTVGASSGYVATTHDLRVDHELRRNLLLYATVAFGTNNFIGIDRDDDIQTVGLGAQFMLNRNFQIDFDLSHRQREATEIVWAFDDFDKNTASITVRMQF